MSKTDHTWLAVIKNSLDSLDTLAYRLRAISAEESIDDSQLRVAIGEIEETTSRISRLLSSLEKNRGVFSKYHITSRELYILLAHIDEDTKKSLRRRDREVIASVAGRLSEATKLWRERIIQPAEKEAAVLGVAEERRSQRREPMPGVRALLLLGAGASRPLRIPTMADFWQIIEANSHSPEEELALRMLLETTKDQTIHLPPDLETLLGMIDRYYGYLTILWEDPLFGARSNWIKYASPFQPLLPWSKEKPQDRFLRNCSHAYMGISRIKGSIMGAMDAAFTKEVNQTELVSLYQPLFSLLNGHFEGDNITIFTTNYDTVIEQFCRLRDIELIDGFHKVGANLLWNPSAYYQKPRPGQKVITLFKLHGSLTWRKIGNEIIEFGMSASTMPGDTALIYPTETKEYPYEEPFKTAYNSLSRLLQTAEVAIVIGYSFRDRGITYIIDEAQSTNPNLKFIIICGERLDEETRSRLPYGCSVVEHDFKPGDDPEYLVQLNELIKEMAKD